MLFRSAADAAPPTTTLATMPSRAYQVPWWQRSMGSWLYFVFWKVCCPYSSHVKFQEELLPCQGQTCFRIHRVLCELRQHLLPLEFKACSLQFADMKLGCHGSLLFIRLHWLLPLLTLTLPLALVLSELETNTAPLDDPAPEDNDNAPPSPDAMPAVNPRAVPAPEPD